MSTHLYCLLTPPRVEARPPALLGLANLPVRSVVASGIEAWVSDAAPNDTAVGDQARQLLVAHALQHNAVLEAALATSRTPMPARFGQRFDDDAAVLREIAREEARLRAVLARIEGSVEMDVIIAPGLRRTIADLQPVTQPMHDATARGAGQQYLHRLRERMESDNRYREVLEKIAKRVTDAVTGLVRDEQRLDPEAGGTPGRGTTMSLAHLIERSRVDDYRLAVAALPPDTEWRVLVAGPRAPYSFCTPEGDAPGMILAG